MGRSGIAGVPKRGAIRAIRGWQRHRGVSRFRRRLGMGRPRGGSGNRDSVRQRERHRMDRRAGEKQRRSKRRPRRVSEPVQHLPSRQPQGRAARHTVARERRGSPQPQRDRGHHREGQRADARVRGPSGKRACRVGGLFARRRRERNAERGIRASADALSLHRISPVSGSGRLSRGRAAVGNFERHQSQHRRVCVEDPVRRISGAGRTRECATRAAKTMAAR